MSTFSMAWFIGQVSHFLVLWFKKSRITISFFQVPIIMPSMKRVISSRSENVEVKEETCLLDLPDLALECILEQFSPVELCSMARVCRSLRDKCTTSDHLWERHMKQKWGRLISYQEWQFHIASTKKPPNLLLDSSSTNQKRFLRYFSILWHLSWDISKVRNRCKPKSCLMMDWYVALEKGKLCFPAQVYNREVQNGHVGFMLSCYDAELRYDSHTDMFRARYSEHGWRTIEEIVGWNRIRASTVDTPPHALHVSDCLNDLKPGDHIEIQWRKCKQFSNGWWYGVVGHLESCEGNKLHCQCYSSETVILEFKQYTPGSRWRQTLINRKEHREVGNETDGFYGGIRKLYNEEEISMWKHLWPTTALE